MLYVVGLGDGDPAALFSDHRDSGALALIEPGTPTNTVDGAPAADLGRDPETWRQIALAPDEAGWGSREISRALTGGSDALGALPGDDLNHRDPGLAMVAALWPILWSHALKDIWGLPARVQEGGLWAAQYVAPEGPLPPIRINDQPYGLLPATSLRRWRPGESDPEGEEALRQVLIRARAIWSEAALSTGNVAGAEIGVDFSGLAPVTNPPNPLEFPSKNLSFQAVDPPNTPNNRIVDIFPAGGDGTGELDLFQRMEVTFPPASRVEAKVVHQADLGPQQDPVIMEAHQADGHIFAVSAGREGQQVFDLAIDGEAIERVVFTSPDIRASLLEFAYQRRTDTERLLQLLGRTASSNAYAYRYFLSLDLVHLLYWAYGFGVFRLHLDQMWEGRIGAVLGLPVELEPERRYATIGWPQDLRIPLVAPPDVPADTPFGKYLGGESFDLPERLIDAPVASWFDIDQGTPSGGLPDSLLARLLLHARFVTAAEVRRAAQGIEEPALEPVADNRNRLTRLATWATEMTDEDLAAAGPVAILYERVREAIELLLETPVAELDRIMRATLDTAAYRIDPWITAFAWRRLRDGAPAAEGFRLGVYGWVDLPRRGTPGPTDGRLLHAPSEQQALAAVVLRDKAIHDAQSDRWDMNLESSTIRRAEQIAEEVRLGSHIQEVLGREIERVAADKATIETLRSRFPMRQEHEGRRVCNGEDVLKADPNILPLNDAQRTALKPLRRALDTYGDLLVAEAVHHVVSGRGAVAGAAMDAAAGLTAPPNLEVISTRRTGRGANTNVAVALPVVAPPPPEEVTVDTSPGEMADPAVAAFLETVVGQPDAVPWRWRIRLPDATTQEVLLSELGLAPIDAVLLSEEELARLVLLAAPEGSVLDTRWLIKRPDGTTQEVLLSELGGVMADEVMLLLPDGSTQEVLLSELGLKPIDAVLLSEEELARLVMLGAAEGNVLGTRWLVRLPDGTTQVVLLSELGVVAGEAMDEAMLFSEEELARRVLAAVPAGSTIGTPEPPEGAEAQRRARRVIDILGRQPAVPADLVDTGDNPPDDAVRAELRLRYQGLRALADLLLTELQSADTSGDAGRQLALRLAARWGITPAVQVGDTLKERVSRAHDALSERLDAAPDAAGITSLAAHQIATAIAELAAPEGQIAVLSRIDLQGWPTTFAAAPTLDRDWLTVNAAVREPLARLEAYQLDAALQNLGPELSAWTNRPDDPWQAGVPATGESGAVPASRLVAIYGPEGVLPGDPADLSTVAAGLLDSWGETIPDPEQATAAAFGFDAPASRAPQAILLAVPPDESEPLTPSNLSVLVDIVAETRELARARMATPAELRAFDAILPLMMLPASGITGVDPDPQHPT